MRLIGSLLPPDTQAIAVHDPLEITFRAVTRDAILGHVDNMVTTHASHALDFLLPPARKPLGRPAIHAKGVVVKCVEFCVFRYMSHHFLLMHSMQNR